MTVRNSGEDPAVDVSSPLTASHRPVEFQSLSEHEVAAFSAFYRADVVRLVSFLRIQGASMPEAADVAQDAMLKAYQWWPSLKSPGAWVRTVATREFIRRRLRTNEIPVDQLLEPATSLLRDDSPSARAELHEQEERVQQLLGLLPPRQRQVMAWSYDGYTPTEIAAELSVPGSPVTPEAIRASLRLARLSLMNHLAAEGGRE